MKLIEKIKLLMALNKAEKSVKEGIKMKNSTKVIGAVIALLTTLLAIPSIQAALTAFLTTHPVVAAVIAGLSTVLALVHNPVSDGNGATSKPPVAPLILLALGLGVASAASAQAVVPDEPIQNLYAAGASYNVNASPSVSGTGLYAHRIVDSTGTYAFTVMDVLPGKYQAVAAPVTVGNMAIVQQNPAVMVTTNVGVGIAQKLFSINKVDFYMPTSAGISWTGANTGWQWTGGIATVIPIKKSGYSIMPTLRFLRSNVSGGSGYQLIPGVLFAWGK